MGKMERLHFLAAEVYGYSYDSYEAHLAAGNSRFTELMPADIQSLIQALEEDWDDDQLASALKVEPGNADFWRSLYRDAVAMVDAESRADFFRQGVRTAIRAALAEGLSDENSIERLVTQICYRAANLGYLLDQEKSPLSRYSEQLRQETEADAAWLISRFGDVSDES